MAKTRHRRAAREAREASTSTNRTRATATRFAAAALLTRDDWTHLEDALAGLLHTDFPSPFTDLELLCSQEAWLVVDLAHVRVRNASGHTFSLRQEIGRVVNALVKLCLYGETLRPWGDLYRSFWTRVLTSAMYHDAHRKPANVTIHRDADMDVAIQDFIRFIQAKGTHVALRWHGRGVNVAVVIDPLRRLLDATTGAPDASHFVPVQIALRFEQCQFTLANVRSLHDLLKLPPDATARLCSRAVLRQLSLRGCTLFPRHLNGLRAILEDPQTRRIDSLCLANTIPPRRPNALDGYAATLQRTLADAVRAKPSLVDVPDPGFRFSLENCNQLDARLLDGVRTALLQATRPICGLSFACSSVADFAAAMQLGRLVNTPLPTATSDWELDVSCVDVYRPCEDVVTASHDDAIDAAMYCSRDKLVKEVIPRITAVLEERRSGTGRVTCRLAIAEIYEEQSLHPRRIVDATEDENEAENHWGSYFNQVPIRTADVTTRAWYEVVAVSAENLFQLVVPTLNGPGTVAGWVHSTGLAGVRIEDDHLVGPTFSQLVLNGATHGKTISYLDRYVTTMVSMNVNLTRLSLEDNKGFSNDMPRYLSLCPRLVELNARETSVRSSFWTGEHMPDWSHASDDTGASLQVLNIADCLMDAASFQSLPPLPSLRGLELAGNTLQGAGLDVLLQRLRGSPTLQSVNVRRNTIPKDTAAARYHVTVVKHAIEKFLKHECMTVSARAAFLSVVFCQRDASLQCLPPETITSIFQMAGARVSPKVEW